MDDRNLLANYLQTRDEQAFALLVHRYLPLVYVAARRQLSDPATAEDVAQAVFILLARKAPALATSTAHASLSGWLLKATHFCVRDTRRLAQRRIHHEQKAAAMRLESTSASDHQFAQLPPQLDAALIKLPAIDRSAIALKFLEGRTLEEVGLTLGLSKDAVNKRIARALQKLRTLLARGNPALSVAALPALLSAAARPIVIPSHLYSTIPAAALHTSAASTTSALIAKGAAHMMSAIKLKLALAAFLLTAAIGSTVFITAQARSGGPPISADDPPAGTSTPTYDAAPNGAATLASGITINIIALADPRSTTFWSPDGSPMERPADFSKLGNTRVQAGADKIGVKFVLQIRAPHHPDLDTRIGLSGSSGTAQTNDDATDLHTYLLASAFPKDKTTTTIRIDLATGPWSMAMESDGSSSPAVSDITTGEQTLSQALDLNGQLAFILSETNQTPTLSTRFTAINTDGKIFQPSSTSVSGTAHLHMHTFKFRQLTADQLKKVVYETRPYDQWIEFRNVSLLPGTITKSEITTSDSEKSK